MVILRFLVGVGMAFFFGPSVILISKYLGKGSEGLGVGILNSAHSLGGIIGIFGWIIVSEIIGWRTSLSNQWNIWDTQWIVLAIRSTDKKL